MHFDLVLQGGLLVDGTGAPARRADVGLVGGRIAAVGLDLRGERVLDCGGLVVAPGFIDTHSHSDLRVFTDPVLPMKLRQGITLEVFGQDGLGAAPVRARDVRDAKERLAGLDGEPQLDWTWETVDDYLTAMERRGAALDRAFLVPHGAIRQWVMGMEDRPATAEELAEMRALLARSLDEGALGMSTGLIYPPCCYATTDELVQLCQVVASRGKVFVVHVRSESDRVLRSIEEMMEVAEGSGVHVHISHFKIAGRDNWRLVEGMLAKVVAAHARGLRISADQYPYIAGSTMLGAILPPWAHAGGAAATVERLSDPRERARMRAQMEDPAPCDWDNFWKWGGPEGIVVADVPSGRRPEVVGKDLRTAAREAGREPMEFAFDLLRDERMGVAMISFSQADAVVARIFREPYVNVCTDALLGGRPHPRAYGAFPRVLRWLVRERAEVTLEEAVRRMTSLAAANVHLEGVGTVAPGQAANLVAFDPATVTDRSTFADPMVYPRGVAHVLVRGEVVVRGEAPTGALPGQVVRRAGQPGGWAESFGAVGRRGRRRTPRQAPAFRKG